MALVKMSKERFVERMIRDKERQALERKEKERQKQRIINDYTAESIVRFRHKNHLKTRNLK